MVCHKMKDVGSDSPDIFYAGDDRWNNHHEDGRVTAATTVSDRKYTERAGLRFLGNALMKEGVRVVVV